MGNGLTNVFMPGFRLEVDVGCHIRRAGSRGDRGKRQRCCGEHRSDTVLNPYQCTHSKSGMALSFASPMG
jgi:hypothetical protein